MSHERWSFMDREDPHDAAEFDAAFARVYACYHPGYRPGSGHCPACNPRSGECWQYMGTGPFEETRCRIIGGSYGATAWVHEFRHRDLPGPNRRVYCAVQASPGWTPKPKLKSAPVNADTSSEGRN